MAKAVVNADTCVGCEACPGTCPVDAIAMEESKAVINVDACIECGSCVPACPTSAISQ
ncbi:MAG: 4Fe-4S binding protein [Synergistaceae bacterium]|nr:4Fe-4S binding protein [Synergistaceae bacterium]